MQCSTAPRFLNYTTDRARRHQRLKVAEKSIIPARSDQTIAVAVALLNIWQRLRRPGSRPTSQRQWAARIRREAQAVNVRFHQSLCKAPARWLPRPDQRR